MANKTRRNPKGAGRPSVMTPDVLQKLEDAFTNAFTDQMACLYAGISEAALYEYCVANPKFAERKEVLKHSPNLIAQKTLVNGLTETGGARWWAERRMPEFMPKTKLELGGKIETQDVTASEAAKAVALKYEEELKQTIAASRTKKAPAPTQ